MSLLDIDFEPELDFGVFFEILNVDIRHREIFDDDRPLAKMFELQDAIKNVRVEADSKGRIRPNKEDIIKVIYDCIPDKNIVQFMKRKNTPKVSFTSGTVEEYTGWSNNSESNWVPKLHVTVTLPEPMLKKEEHGSWSSFNYRDLITISLIDRRLLSDPDWLADVERRKNKTKKFW